MRCGEYAGFPGLCHSSLCGSPLAKRRTCGQNVPGHEHASAAGAVVARSKVTYSLNKRHLTGHSLERILVVPGAAETVQRPDEATTTTNDAQRDENDQPLRYRPRQSPPRPLAPAAAFWCPWI